MHRRKSANIAYALLDREHGIQRSHLPKPFKRIALELVEYSLLERLKNEDLCRPLDDLSNETESVFNVEQSYDGCYAATVQTNKSVNVFEVSSMRKVAEYHTNERSVWTLAFHPKNPNIIAFGTLGGKVFIYINGKEEAWLDEREPIGSLCFHPVDDYLVLTSGSEVTFWDWKTDSMMNTGTYNDCKCRFLRITSSSMLITGISQTSLFASAGIGKNLPSVEPQYLMASFLRTVNFMLDSLEHGCTIGNSFNAELKKQFHFWNYLLKIIMDKKQELRCFASVEPDSKCTKSYLNNTLTILNRRIESILETVDRIVFRLLPDADGCVEQEYIEKFCRNPMLYFEQVCSNFVEQRYSGYIRYIFDLSLVKNMLHKIFKLFFDYGHKPPPFEEWLTAEYYIDSSIYARNTSQKNQFILQAWDLGDFRDTSALPDFKEDWKNVLSICSINNDSNVAISQCEQYIASVQSKAVHEMEVRSLSRANFGECMFVFRFTANFVSLSFSPSAKYIVIGLRCKKRMKFAYILDKDTRWKIGVDFRYDLSSSDSRDSDTSSPNDRVGLKLCLPKETFNYKEINCIKWTTLPGYGFFIGLKSKFIQICR